MRQVARYLDQSRYRGFKRPAILLLILGVFLAARQGHAAGTWTALTNQAPGGVSLMLQLPDGTVMCQNSGNAAWYRLTPDIHGSYVNGTWTSLVLPAARSATRYYSSQVLPGDQVYVAGGEYGTGKSKAEVYSITNNSWTQAATPPDDIIDNISEVLPNGNIPSGRIPE